MFCIFEENSKWLVFANNLWVKNFAEIALSRTVFEIKAFLCFVIFVTNSKIQNGRQWWDKKSLKRELPTQQIYPADQKFRRNRSI